MEPAHQKQPERESMRDKQHIGRVIWFIEIPKKRFHECTDSIKYIGTRFAIRDSIVERAKVVSGLHDFFIVIWVSQMSPILFSNSRVFNTFHDICIHTLF